MASKAEIAQFVLGTGFVTTLLNQTVAWWIGSIREKKNKEQESTYLALRIAIILEAFAFNCADKVSNARNDLSIYFQARPDLSLPVLESYPAVDSWKLVRTGLAARLLSFPNILELGKQEMSGCWDMGDPEDRPYVMMGFLAKYGLYAWNIAVDLRKEYKLSSFSPKDTSWDAVECLQEELKKHPEIKT